MTVKVEGMGRSMRGWWWVPLCAALGMSGCQRNAGTPPPPDGWANHAPTEVKRTFDRGKTQLLLVSQGHLEAWVQVPSVEAKPGDYILLGQGTARSDVEIPEIGQSATQVVDIAHARVVDFESAKRAVVRSAPKEAVRIGTVYSELKAREGQAVVVYGTVVKASSAIGWNWVHLRDGSGDPSAGTHDLTVKTSELVTQGQRVAFRGTLRADVDLGFGYHYEALVEGGELVE